MTWIRASSPDVSHSQYYPIDMYKPPSFFRVFPPEPQGPICPQTTILIIKL